jgi:hypothetical protein
MQHRLRVSGAGFARNHNLFRLAQVKVQHAQHLRDRARRLAQMIAEQLQCLFRRLR